ncbi:hypothetical protein H5T51_06070 [Candidatus Bathyarchaeota archaeon]|nr:hypothetical protein [Candidatus Bathyarchaeota archaeon]
MLRKSFAVSVSLALLLIVSAVAQVQAFRPLDEEERAERILQIAKTAYSRVNETVTRISQNETIMELLEAYNLLNYFNGNVSLLEEANATIEAAQEAFGNGEYEDAVEYVLEAMKTIRSVFRNFHDMLEEIGVKPAEEKPELQAQGLLVAINRSLERIERLEEILARAEISEDDAQEVEDLLEQARSLLNVEEAERLLEEGNVTEVAHRLGEANRLIAQAHVLLKAKAAEAKMEQRLERYRLKIEERLNRTLERLNETAIGKIMGRLRFKHQWEFRHHIGNLIEQAKNHTVKWKKALKDIGETLKDFMEAYVVEELPASAQSENLGLELEVEKTSDNKHVIIVVTATNTGDVSLIFPNPALGMTIERNVEGEWKPYYSPITIQVLFKLSPGEDKSVSVRLREPPEGLYRVVVHANSELTYTPISATAEFTIP